MEISGDRCDIIWALGSPLALSDEFDTYKPSLVDYAKFDTYIATSSRLSFLSGPFSIADHSSNLSSLSYLPIFEIDRFLQFVTKLQAEKEKQNKVDFVNVNNVAMLHVAEFTLKLQ